MAQPPMFWRSMAQVARMFEAIYRSLGSTIFNPFNYFGTSGISNIPCYVSVSEPRRQGGFLP